MARQFKIPDFYQSSIISRVKQARQGLDRLKRDLSPSMLDFGPVRIHLARHFGFCYGVENAIEIAYRIIEMHPDRRVFFLSEMIHNPNVNRDLENRGVHFIFTPSGERLIDWEVLDSNDIVVVPAFGTTLEIQEELADRGIDPYTYNTTCPFVEKVWSRSLELGEAGYTVVVHGKSAHEETRATFSHSIRSAPTVVVLDLKEAYLLADLIRGKFPREVFYDSFGHKCSDQFDPDKHLKRIGVVNQTTMLASETRKIADELKRALVDRYGEKNLGEHFADTSDTLCYATNENQNATFKLIERGADLVLVVGGHNSSNTSHIVELCQNEIPTYFIKNADEMLSVSQIRHYVLDAKTVIDTENWLPGKRPVDLALTSGASCPDAVLDEVLIRLLSFFSHTRKLEEVLEPFLVYDVESS